MSSVRTSHERKLYGKSQTSEEAFVPVRLVYCVSTDSTLMWICVLITECDLRYEDMVKIVSFSKHDIHKKQFNEALLRTLT